jgi:Flp pilus assembly protein TadG
MIFPKAEQWQRGAALVEFCIVLPLFVVLLLGAIDWGWYFAIRETAINATREGARAGSVAPSTATAVADAGTAVQNYLSNALGKSYMKAPTVTTDDCSVAGSKCISVELTDYPVVAGRPESSITGLVAWTHVPTSLTVKTEMRLEQP